MVLRRLPPRRRQKGYPRVIYGPYGAKRTIHGPSEQIEGWGDRPRVDDDVPVAGAFKPDLPRAEAKRRLREAGIAFDELASTRALNEALSNGN